MTVDYDRTELSTRDVLRATATLRYDADIPTYMVIVDLGIPPGFTVDAGDFAEMVEEYSRGPRAEEGGLYELTDESLSAWWTPVPERVRALPIGAMSEPLRAASRIHIIEIVDHRVGIGHDHHGGDAAGGGGHGGAFCLRGPWRFRIRAQRH